MKLWHLKIKGRVTWDSTSDSIVVAQNEETARKIANDGKICEDEENIFLDPEKSTCTEVPFEEAKEVIRVINWS